MQELFTFKHVETSQANEKIHGYHSGCGLRPMFQDKFKEAAITLPSELFGFEPQPEAKEE